MRCVHCKREVRRLQARNLCWPCYRNPTIRPFYGRIRPKTGGAVNPPDVEPSEDEVERTIREQMENLPDWWKDDCVYVRVYTLVKCT